MKAVIAKIPDSLLAWRSRTGADRWDENWEGVLHMPPMPNRDHQNFEWSLETYLRLRWARPQGCKVFHQINLSSLGGWPDDYRIPDLVLLTPDRFDVDRNEYFEGPPSAVVEIRSPDD
ncbi:MAG: Uma2 family endonuclease, partial [Planctomycetota bacterium]|nr:Uma2 family endonuclease [Planctomycetota bacterium]